MSPADCLYSITQIRAIEQAAAAMLPPHALMERAGKAAALVACRILDGIGKPARSSNPPVLIAAGPGNNGGDAFECAVFLARHGCRVTVLVPAENAGASADHVQARAKARASPQMNLLPITFADTGALPALARQRWALAIDGLFGIGLTSPLRDEWRPVVAFLNAIDAPLLALDVPSGLNADTGAVPGGTDRQSLCIRATHTVTFIGNKPGLHTCAGRDQAGEVSVADLDIESHFYPLPVARRNSPASFGAARHARAHDSHKGSFGDVQIIGGAAGMVGAAILAAHAALKTGAGRVLIGFMEQVGPPAIIASHPELMCRSADALDFSGATLVVGPGLGDSTAAESLTARACGTDVPLVLDADGLNLLAATPALQAALAARSGSTPTILTPHPLEAARLLGITAAEIQADRLQAAAALAERFQATVILKGSGTVIAHGNQLTINPTGNPALASGGTGDVLAGICGALLAQGWPAQDTALAAVWLHGAAADSLVERGIGPVGVTASEIIDAARTVLNDLIAERSSERSAGERSPVDHPRV